MTKQEILKKYMSVKYCTGNRFDYLDTEEITMIYKAMEAYKAHVSNKRFFCDMESKKEERCETQCLLCTEIE